MAGRWREDLLDQAHVLDHVLDIEDPFVRGVGTTRDEVIDLRSLVGRPRCVSVVGSSIQKVLPSPGRLEKSNVPFMDCARWRDKRQAEPRAGKACLRSVEALEGGEQPAQRLGRDAPAGVGDADPHPPVGAGFAPRC